MFYVMRGSPHKTYTPDMHNDILTPRPEISNLDWLLWPHRDNGIKFVNFYQLLV